MFRKCICLILLVLCVLFTHAQPGPPGAPCWPPPCVPVDGGIAFFVAIAAFFGYKFSSKTKN